MNLVNKTLIKYILAAIFFLPVLLHVNRVFAEEEKTTTLGEVCVTATRTEKDPYDVPSMVHELSSETLQEERMVRTVPEALKEIPGIMVQKTSHGQGSPYIRGFTGFRTLFMVDGIRLNNSVFRDGPNQYWNTVDPFSIERLEVVKGPGSVLFGSDAVGGTVNAITETPKYGDVRYLTNGRLYGRYAEAENSYVGRAEVGGGYEKNFGWLIGTSYKDFGDLEGGDEVGRQPKTGYDEWDGDVKLEYCPTPDSKIVLAHQNVDLNDAWRTHKTIYGINWEGTTHGSEKERILDQKRHLTYAQYLGKNMGAFFDGLQLSLSYQEQKEVENRIRSDDRSDYQGFEVGTIGLLTQFDTCTSFGAWTYGAEYYRDGVDSFKRNYRSDGSFSGEDVQGPVADDAAYDLLGAFIQDDIPISNSFDMIIGTRYTYAHVDADQVKDPETGNEMSISEHWDSVAGSIRAIYYLDQEDHYNLFGGISQGFRAPNLSDLTRLDSARSNEIETAAPELDPEEFISYEIGLKTRFDNFSSQVAYYYTDVHDMIIRTPTGNIIDGDIEVTKKNAGDGYIHGVELGTNWRLHPGFEVFGNFAWIDGEVDSYPTSSPEKEEEPVSRLMPTTYLAGLRWAPTHKYWLEGLVTIASRQDNLSSDDKRDTDRIPPDGTPGYDVYTIRGGWNVTKSFTLSAALENITDEDYRIHGSGQNEPGRNLVMALDYRF